AYNGGGHASPEGLFNGIVSFDFNGTTAPLGFVLEPGSWSTAAVAASGGDTYSDGRPGGVHSYDGMEYDPTDQVLYRFGGSTHPSGAGSTKLWGYSFPNGEWTDYGTYGGSTDLSICTLFDLATRKLLCMIGGTLQYRVFDCAEKEWLGSATFFQNPSPSVH